MQPLTPPPASDTGAITFPRQLQKWLDCNPITALTRTQAFITLPSFNVSGFIEWFGVSDIVASFNFEGPNNFSLAGLSQLPVNPNYFLCISWRDNNGNIYRYALWQNVGEVILFDIPLYNNQIIMKNFRFEVWSTSNSNGTVSQTTPIQIYTSKLGGVDYRWGTDFILVNADPISTLFNVSGQGYGMTVTNCTANGYYVFSGIQNNAPYYTDLSTGYTIVDNGFWEIAVGLLGSYQGTPDTNTPDLVTTWVGAGEITVPPAPVLTKSETFYLPVTFPVGSYSQPNSPQFILLENNNTKVPAGQVVFASSGGGVQGAG